MFYKKILKILLIKFCILFQFMLLLQKQTTIKLVVIF